MSYDLSEASIPSYKKTLDQMVRIIRMYMRDHTALNRLIDKEETSDRMIAWAILDAIDDYNSRPPLIGNMSLNSIKSLSILRDKVVCTILESLYLIQTRNRLSYTDNGLSVSISDKGNEIMRFIQFLESRYERKIERLKIALNLEQSISSYGAVSEYFYINGLYFNYY